jgi:hypothetical protein
MDEQTKKKLIIIGAVLIAGLAFYFIASPYQNCIRGYGGGSYAAVKCTESTSW